jgi:hypothetical protein
MRPDANGVGVLAVLARAARYAEAGKPIDPKRLYAARAVVSDLMSALRGCAAVCAGEVMNKNGLIDALETARSALSRANGDR